MSNCIEHNQAGRRDGYATTSRRVKGRKITELLHRAIYVRYNKISYQDIDGLHVRHTCDNPRCINPLHLVIGTRQDNMSDMAERKRIPSGERHHNSKLTWENVKYLRSSEKEAKELSEMFGVAVNTIKAIIDNKSWKED